MEIRVLKNRGRDEDQQVFLSASLLSLAEGGTKDGMSPKIGTLVDVSPGLSSTRPPMTRVLAFGNEHLRIHRAGVKLRRLANVAPDALKVAYPKKVATVGTTFKRMVLLAEMRGVTNKTVPTFE